MTQENNEKTVILNLIKIIKNKLTELESAYAFAREKRNSVTNMTELNYTNYTRSMYKKAKTDIDDVIKKIQEEIIVYENKLDEMELKLESLDPK